MGQNVHSKLKISAINNHISPGIIYHSMYKTIYLSVLFTYCCPNYQERVLIINTCFMSCKNWLKDQPSILSAFIAKVIYWSNNQLDVCSYCQVNLCLHCSVMDYTLAYIPLLLSIKVTGTP